MLTNIPKGRYAISEIVLDGHITTTYYPTYWNQGWSRYDSAELPTSGPPGDIRSWIELDTNGIGNFEYLILSPTLGGDYSDCRGNYYESLEGIRASSELNNYKYYRHPVPRYFLNKFPDSEWAPYLRQLFRK